MDNSGQAFPALNFIVPYDLEERHVKRIGESQGMSLRDYFAGKAMQSMIGMWATETHLNEDIVVRGAYSIADAMLVQRAKDSK